MKKRLAVTECRNYIKHEFQQDNSYIKKSVYCRTENDKDYERVYVQCRLNGWAYLFGHVFNNIVKQTGMHLNYYAHFGQSVEVLFVRQTVRK